MGDDSIDSFLKQYEKEPGAIYRFRGFFSQYMPQQGVSHRFTNFRFFKWDIAPGQEPRAAFILKGEITGTATSGELGIISMKLVQPAQNGYPEKKEDFKLYVFEPGLLKGFEAGQFWELRGFLQQGEGEDEYGAAKGPVLPFVLDAKEIK